MGVEGKLQYVNRRLKASRVGGRLSHGSIADSIGQQQFRLLHLGQTHTPELSRYPWLLASAWALGKVKFSEDAFARLFHRNRLTLPTQNQANRRQFCTRSARKV